MPQHYTSCQCCPNVSIIIYRGIHSPEHGKEVTDGINVIDNRYMYQLMSNVKLSGLETFDSQILMYSFTHRNDVSMDKQFQKHLHKEHCKHGFIDQVKYRKRSSKIKWTDI